MESGQKRNSSITSVTGCTAARFIVMWFWFVGWDVFLLYGLYVEVIAPLILAVVRGSLVKRQRVDNWQWFLRDTKLDSLGPSSSLLGFLESKLEDKRRSKWHHFKNHQAPSSWLSFLPKPVPRGVPLSAFPLSTQRQTLSSVYRDLRFTTRARVQPR